MKMENIRNFSIIAHIDHGKSTLADRLLEICGAVDPREMREQYLDSMDLERERGITIKLQSVRLDHDAHLLNFIDTPGHAAFTQMRARGAQVTDLVVLVVAANDGVMPQTVEAIDHSKAAGVPIVVAVNKIDKENANVDRVKGELAEYDLAPEEWGGQTIFCEPSANQNTGIN